MIPKRTSLFVHISDPQMDTLYSSISMTPKCTPYFAYISDFKMATLCFFISDHQMKFRGSSTFRQKVPMQHKK